MKTALFSLFLIIVFQTTTVQAKDGTNAILAKVEGDVLLFQGDRYVPVQSGKRVADGDRLLIMADSQVHTIYDSDCEVTWDGEVIAEVDMEQCPTLAGWFIPCVGAVAGAGDDEDIILTKIDGSVLLQRDGQYLAAEEGQVLEDKDQLKIDGLAEINYKGACSITHEGSQTILVDQDSCPVAVLEELEGKALVNEGQGFMAVEEGVELKYGHEVKVLEESKIKIAYYNGCDEEWEGLKTVKVNEESCPLGAPVPLNCSPAVLGSLTPTALAVGVIGGIIIWDPNGNHGNKEPVPLPPVSP